jgi:hypothetical protein
VASNATYNHGEKLSMFVLAALVLVGSIGSAFAAGFVIGRILL